MPKSTKPKKRQSSKRPISNNTTQKITSMVKKQRSRNQNDRSMSKTVNNSYKMP